MECVKRGGWFRLAQPGRGDPAARAGLKGPILLLEGFFHADELAVLDQYRLTTSVHSNWQIKALQQAKLRAPLISISR